MNNLADKFLKLTAVAVLSFFLAVPLFAGSDCSFIKDFENPKNFRCGKLAVPEDHAKPEGRNIEIAYVVVPAASKNPKSEAVIYFSGGPGGGSLNAGFIDFIADSPLTENRDLVLLDQRGIQYSSPLPDIGEGVFRAMAADTDLEGEREMIAKVLAEYRKKADAAGIDLGAYNSFQNAMDVVLLMEKLGYKRYDLFGISYGTRLARVIQDLLPEKLNTVILDSPTLMTDDFLIDRMKSFSSSADKTFKACKANEVCRKEFPDLEKEYVSVIEKLKMEPIKIEFDNRTFHINSQDAMYFLRRQLYRSDALVKFPGFVAALKNRDEEILKGAIAAEFRDVSEGSFNTSMFLAVSAFESMDPENTPEVIGKLYDELPHFPDQLGFFTSLYLEGMDWHGKSIKPDQRLFKMSSVPTIIFVNQYDPVTPPENGRLFQKKLKSSHLFVIDAGGHAGGNFQCKMKMMTAFMDDRTKIPDASCLPLYR